MLAGGFTGLDAIIIYLVALGLIGLGPVAFDVFFVNRPSKWEPQKEWNVHTPLQRYEVHSQENNILDEFEMPTQKNLEAFDQSEVPATSDIPVYSADEIYVEEPQHSIPTDDMLENVESLLNQVQENDEEDYSPYFEFNSDLKMFEKENIMVEGEVINDSPLSEADFHAIEKKYGSKVVNMITATPQSTNVNGFATMIGRIVESDNNYYLEYGGERVHLIGNIPHYKNEVHVDEVFLINGHYIDIENFRIESWIDPELVQHGYVDGEEGSFVAM